MTRCLAFPRLFMTACLALCAGLLPTATPAQVLPRTPPIPAKAQAGLLLVTTPPEVLLNGQPARLSPGVRIRSRDNLLVLSVSLAGQELPVRYTRDTLGLVHEVWILTDTELQALRHP